MPFRRVCAVAVSTALGLATTPVVYAGQRIDTPDNQAAELERGSAAIPKARPKSKGPVTGDLSVGTFELSFSGEISAVDQKSLSRAFATGLARGKSLTLRLGTAEAAQKCQDADCWQKLGRKKKVDVAIWAEVQVESRDYRFHIVARDTRSGEQVAEHKTTCDICGISEAESMLKDGASQLREKLDQLAKLAELKVTVEPAGSQIFINGKFRGLSPVVLHLAPGEHAIEVRHDSYLSTERTVTLVGGIAEHQEFALERKLEISKRKRGWAIASVSVGALSLAAGGTLLALHGRPDRGNCSMADGTQDANGDCKYLWNLRWFGYGATLIGAAGVGWGVSVLLNRSLRKRARAKAKSSSGADVQVGVGPASLSLSGRF